MKNTHMSALPQACRTKQYHPEQWSLNHRSPGLCSSGSCFLNVWCFVIHVLPCGRCRAKSSWSCLAQGGAFVCCHEYSFVRGQTILETLMGVINQSRMQTSLRVRKRHIHNSAGESPTLTVCYDAHTVLQCDLHPLIPHQR